MLNIDLHKEHFRHINAKDNIKRGTLVWIERNDHFSGDTLVLGPFITTKIWNFSSFDTSGVTLLCTKTGEEEVASYRSFLYSTYYIIKEEKHV